MTTKCLHGDSRPLEDQMPEPVTAFVKAKRKYKVIYEVDVEVDEEIDDDAVVYSQDSLLDLVRQTAQKVAGTGHDYWKYGKDNQPFLRAELADWRLTRVQDEKRIEPI